MKGLITDDCTLKVFAGGRYTRRISKDMLKVCADGRC